MIRFRLAGWVEEVQDISRKLGSIFNNIVREANVLADDLAREGAFHSSISFDV